MKKKIKSGAKDKIEGRKSEGIKILTGYHLDSGGWRVCIYVDRDKD